MAEEHSEGIPLIDPEKVKAVVSESAPEPSTPAPQPQASKVSTLGEKEYIWGLGRRKKAIARVRIRPGSGKIVINKRDVDAYFTSPRDQNDVRAPLAATDSLTRYDVWANVQGGGSTGQAGAVVLGIARALAKADSDTYITLKGKGYLTRDSRIVERKKYGQRGARRSFQFSKR
jgi:small subunit ribosomal protein S9